jgi:two-component system KDP operon response regulator KdpE
MIVVLPVGPGGSLATGVVEDCLDAGADAVMSAALGRRELAARISAAIRSKPAKQHRSLSQKTFECGNLIVSEPAHTASIDGERIPLTPTEFRLLAALAQRSGRVARHEDLIATTWGSSAETSPRVLRLYVGYLRRKLAASRGLGPLVVNQRGVGYRLAEAVAS